MSKIRCERPHCYEDAEYVVTTSRGDKKFLCRKHGQDLMKTLAMIKLEKLEK